MVILVIVGFVVNLVLLTTFIAAIVTTGSALFLLLSVVVLVVDVLLAGIYFIYTWTNLKASPGQRILGMLTVSESDGSVLTFNQALARFVIMFAPGYVASLASIGRRRHPRARSCRSPASPGRSSWSTRRPTIPSARASTTTTRIPW